MTDQEINDVIGHDSPMDQKCRIYASISFAVLLLGVGLPLWWETTAVPRVAIPYVGIRALDDLELHIHVRFLLGCLDTKNSQQLADELMQRLMDARFADIYRISLSHFGTTNTSIARAKTLDDLNKAAAGFQLNHGDILVLEAPAGLGENLIHVTSGRSIYFAQNTDSAKIAQVLCQWIYRDAALTLTKNALTEPTEYSLDVVNRRRFPVSSNYDVLLTVVNPEPELLQVDRNFSHIAQDYIDPFLEELSIIADFSIKSQWLYFLPLGVKPKEVPANNKFGRYFALSEDILPQVITPLEKKLASQVSLYPTINLVAYMVPCKSAPLHIFSRNGRRVNEKLDLEPFHSPRWGGIVLINPSAEFCKQAKANKIFKPPVNITTKVFLTHLRLLLGIPDKEEISRTSMAELSGLKPRDWEVDDLLRMRSVEQLTSAKLTLQSLARLLREISNIVITETVGGRIMRALELIELSAKLLNEGDLKGGFLASKEAFVMSEAAFTDPSLLALLYFPDDQKYAVYIPLFLPIMIPVLFSLKNIKNYLFCSDQV
ncbi:PREDICTED: GPI transamidase component PIG-S [Ceratosolen solmsi marchali]|uniref:GPI transamidase component PIG-S n=1 Tax=Ceratosolen solmsi marchali TaxID=326594 RepID=A0AAJ6VL38_9HYME|nr:PREDICTED: GPI transamidase component PIG-S [Ceratosolen solmsi marchali]